MFARLLGLVFRQQGDNGVLRQRATASPNDILKRLALFKVQWRSVGTNRNENIHKKLRRCLATNKIGTIFLYAKLWTLLHKHIILRGINKQPDTDMPQDKYTGLPDPPDGNLQEGTAHLTTDNINKIMLTVTCCETSSSECDHAYGGNQVKEQVMLVWFKECLNMWLVEARNSNLPRSLPNLFRRMPSVSTIDPLNAIFSSAVPPGSGAFQMPTRPSSSASSSSASSSSASSSSSSAAAASTLRGGRANLRNASVIIFLFWHEASLG